jgi:Uma2 family endonuclease
MALLHDSEHLTEADYLALEHESEIKHEYVGGTVYAMSGASLRHNLIAGNLVTALNPQLADSPCLVSPGDMRVKIAAARLSYRYPDVSVTCAPPEIDGANPGSLLNPAVLIEVLSSSTALVDRNEKLREYRQIPTLYAYLLVSQDTPRIERYLRQNEQDWLYTEAAGLDASVALPDLKCALKLADIYRKVTFNEP